MSINDSEVDHRSSVRQSKPSSTGRAVGLYLIAGCIYLAIAVIVWLHVWTGHPSATTTCGCGDPASSIWFTSWPAYAIAHGHNPLFTTTIGHPYGVNLIFAAYGIALAPITWLLGPVTALNVALTLSPVASSLAMFALMRRWVAWAPAGFVAGLFYGFSPLVLANLGSAHIDLILLAIPPLVVMALDELLIRQRRHPIGVGILLGLLVTLQFFIGIEILVLMTIEAVIGLVVLILYGARRQKDKLSQHARRAAKGLCASAATAAVLLAYPAWFALAGPAHLTGSLHPGVRLSSYGGSLGSFLFPASTALHGAFSSIYFSIVGGYQGPVLSQQYFGIGVFVVCVAGLLVWKDDLRLRLFGTLAAISLVLVVASGPFMASFPLLKDIVPLHFVVFAYLFVAIVLGIAVDRTRTLANQRSEARSSTSGDQRSRMAAVLAATLVSLIAIAPPAAYLATGIPLTVQPIAIPTWFANVAPKLASSAVVLVLPAPFTVTKGGLAWYDPDGHRISLAISGKQSALTWVALSGHHYSVVGAGGLGAGVGHRTDEDQGQNVITQVTFAYRSLPPVTGSDIQAVRRALSGWGVTTIVLPDQPGLPSYDRVASVAAMAGLMTAATGQRPVHTANAWEWPAVGSAPPLTFSGPNQFSHCVGVSPNGGTATVIRVNECLLSAD